jgi:hypothetical protein
MTYGHLKPAKATQNYVQRVFGFKLHKPWRKFDDKTQGSRSWRWNGTEKRRDVCEQKRKIKRTVITRMVKRAFMSLFVFRYIHIRRKQKHG